MLPPEPCIRDAWRRLWEALAAQVPRLILQPLVENSIRHGIAMRSAAGKVAIRAWRQGDRLALVVWDDGPGIPDGAVLREGVGRRRRIAPVTTAPRRGHTQ